MAAEARGRAADYPLESVFGLIAKAGLASMDEMLDADGVWSEDLIRLMLPVAIEMQLDEAQVMHDAVSAAVSGLFSKEARQAYGEHMKGLRSGIRASHQAARGMKPAAGQAPAAAAGPDPATQFLDVMKRMGVKVPQPVRRPKGKPGKDKGKNQGRKK